jgi:hypothetical protein
MAFDRGLAEMKAGHFNAACPSIEESYHLDPQAGTLFTLAECEAKRGRIATAVTRYRDYLDLFAQLSGAEKSRQSTRAKIAAAKRAKLEPQIPRLTLLIPPDAPSELVVTCDGATVAEAALGTGLAVDAGEHLVTTQVRGGPVVERHIDIAIGAQKQILLAIQRPQSRAPEAATSAATTPTTPDETPKSTSDVRVGAYVLGGLGLAGLAAGAALGGLALGQRNLIDEHCPNRLCDPPGLNAVQSVKTYGLASTVGFVAGGALLAASTVMFFASSPTPSASTRSRGTSSALFISAGSAGAVVGLTGGF